MVWDHDSPQEVSMQSSFHEVPTHVSDKDRFGGRGDKMTHYHHSIDEFRGFLPRVWGHLPTTI